MGFRTLRDEAFNVSGGTVRKAQRQQSGSDQSWNITVQPDGHGDVSIQLPATGSCRASGAICTSGGRPLSNGLAATVTGPAAMTVADARVKEVANAVVPCAVTLSRTATAQVTVDYTTRDGSAQAASDYTAKSSTRRSRPASPARRSRPPRRLPRRGRGDLHAGALPNASGAWLQDAEATGTIENTDLMPAALLARFGRVTAEQVVQHVEERMAAPRDALSLILATSGQGMRVPTWPPRRHAAAGGESSVCLLCMLWRRRRGGYRTSAFSEDVEESDWSSTPVGYYVVYDVTVNQ